MQPEISPSPPIRVVMLGSGPRLEAGVKKFILRLDNHPEIEFLGAFCESRGEDFRAIMVDLWRRRGWLAAPLALAYLWEEFSGYLFHPASTHHLNQGIRRLADKIHYHPDLHSREVLDKIRFLEPDLGLVYSSPILKKSLFGIPKLGTLGIHHGTVPQYRGKKTTFWEIFNGEEAAGVTIQRINAGLDTGEIVKTGEVRIGRRPAGRIWRELEHMGLELYLEAILAVKAGTATYKTQEGQKGRLYRDPKITDLVIFQWRQIKRLLRGVPGSL